MIVRDRLSGRRLFVAQTQASYVAGSPVPLPLPPFCLLVSYKTLGNYCATLTQNVLNGALPIGNSQARLGGQLHQRYLEFSVDPERGSELPPQQDLTSRRSKLRARRPSPEFLTPRTDAGGSSTAPKGLEVDSARPALGGELRSKRWTRCWDHR